ncbi:uncharacterized protein FFC1_05032 [Fusarium fujikuroi]|nr:uncharacterized protein FFC1_05032 [Fusarium fujikuroi]
MPDSRANL